MAKFTEAILEQAIIDLLGKQGYPYVPGESIERGIHDVLIKEDLRAFLNKQYKLANIAVGEIDSIIRQIELLPAADLYDSNKTFIKWVSDGFLLKREDHTQKDLYIQLLDYAGLAEMRELSTDEVDTIVAEEQAIANLRKQPK